MKKNRTIIASTIACLTAISTPVYSHSSEITHTHFGAELIALLFVVGIIAISLLRK